MGFFVGVGVLHGNHILALILEIDCLLLVFFVCLLLIVLIASDCIAICYY